MNGFTARNLGLRLVGHPQEDDFGIDKYGKTKVLAVANGVTRDPAEFLPDTSRFFGRLSFAWHYPRPSPATYAAQIFCMRFLLCAGANRQDNNAVKKAMIDANKTIEYFNLCLGERDYLCNDYAGCVGAGAILENGCIRYGFIADSGVALFRGGSNGDFVFMTPDEGPSKVDAQIWSELKKEFGENINWRMPLARREIRSQYRNNPKNNASYGVLTGEDSAIGYMRTGEIERKQDDIVFLFTDGVRGIFNSGEGIDLIRRRDFYGLESLCNYRVHSEGALVWGE